MECLSKRVEIAMQTGAIQGIRLTQNAPVLTHTIYADDLVIMGRASGEEASAFKAILEDFGSFSGLEVNPDKSTVWWSKRCTVLRKQEVLGFLQATVATEKERYLGVILAQGRMQQRHTGEMLVKKFQQKLAGWKVALLSRAGRMVLIQSVLSSVPVYYMSIEKLSAKIINELEGLMRRFLWGKTGRERYMAMVAWHKVCVSQEEGGLWIKNIKIFNQALIQKLIWQLGSEQDGMWVQIVKAKYCTTGSVWSSTINRNTSALWKAIQEYKGEVLINLQWQIGDGTKIEVSGQPWYPNSSSTVPGPRNIQGVKVAEIYDHQTRRWKEEEIAQMLGSNALQSIKQLVRHPVRQSVLEDRLVWMASKKGAYTVKKGYTILTPTQQVRQTYSEKQSEAFKAIWKWKELVPKVRLFLWRAVHKGLTTTHELAKRIQTIQPICPRCKEENDFTMHLLFFCPISRVTWFASPFALRVHELPLDFAEALLAITKRLEHKQISPFCNMLRSLWEARNEELFASKKPTPEEIIARVRKIETEGIKKTGIKCKLDPDPIRVAEGSKVILVDGSWDIQNRAGTGMGVYNRRGDLVYVRFDKVEAADPFQAEARAMLYALRYVVDRGNEGLFICCSDSRILIQAIQNESVEGLPSWQAAEQVKECINLKRAHAEKNQVSFIKRDAVSLPHELANWARKSEKSEQGTPIQCHIGHMNIAHRLSSEFFILERNTGLLNSRTEFAVT